MKPQDTLKKRAEFSLEDALAEQRYANVLHTLYVEHALEYLFNEKEEFAVFREIEDPERPHDYNGKNHKGEFEVWLALALDRYVLRNNETPLADYNKKFREALEDSISAHRSQRHHVEFNGSVPSLPEKLGKMHYNIVVGSVDLICSLLDPFREYRNGGSPLAIDKIEEMMKDRSHPNWVGEMSENKLAWLSYVYTNIKPVLGRLAGLREIVPDVDSLYHVSAEKLGIQGNMLELLKKKVTPSCEYVPFK